MAENLRSFFCLDYPDYELLFCVAEMTDPALDVVAQLCLEFPEHTARILTEAHLIGPNPKVNNLVQAYEEARHDWVLISDSNVRVRPDYLRKMASLCAEDVGVITAVVSGQNPRDLGGHLEATFLNTHYCRWMLLAEWFGIPCVLGKSMLFRKSTAKRFGGIRNLARYLAEDYMAGVAMQYLGLRVVLMHEPVTQVIGAQTIGHFWSRHLRWGRIRKSQAGLAFVFEPFLGCMLSFALGALGVWLLWPWAVVPMLAIHFSLWVICEAILMRVMGQPLGPIALLSWMLRELLALPMWFHIAIGNTVYWRGRNLRIERGGVLSS